MAAEIATTGKGREYELNGPAGFWRNFATMEPDDDDAIVDFIRRKGDPLGQLSPDVVIDTGQWKSVADWLWFMADLWDDPPAADGVSRITEDDARRVRVTEAIIESPLFQRGIEWRPAVNAKGDLVVRLSPKRLVEFMLASAVLQAQTRELMSRCEQCGDWFAVQRQGTRFCSASCRAASSTSKKERK